MMPKILNYIYAQLYRYLIKKVTMKTRSYWLSFKGFQIGYHSYLQEHCRLKGDVRIGNYTKINRDVVIDSSPPGKIIIGDNCLIANGVTFRNANHGIARTDILIKNQPKVVKDIIVKNDVWIAANCVILPGVTIGEGSVIGAGAVVTKSIPPYSVAVGVPAKVIKQRNSRAFQGYGK